MRRPRGLVRCAHQAGRRRQSACGRLGKPTFGPAGGWASGQLGQRASSERVRACGCPNALNLPICSPRCLIFAARSVSHPGKRWHLRETRTGAAMGRTRRKQARAERSRMGSQSVGKRARETAQGQKICRNIDLCKSRGRNLPESGPPRRFRVKKLSECRPVQTLQLHKSRFRQDFLSHAPRDGSATAQVAIPGDRAGRHPARHRCYSN